MKSAKRLSILVLAVLLQFVAPAFAGILSVSGSITTADPLGDQVLTQGTPPTGQFGAPLFYYDTYAFTVSSSGTYRFTLNGVFGPDSPGGWYSVYLGDFDPVNPLDNVLHARGGRATTLTSTLALTEGITYEAVITTNLGFNTSVSPYEFSILGDGTPSLVPLPATLPLVALGLVGLAALRRRRGD